MKQAHASHVLYSMYRTRTCYKVVRAIELSTDASVIRLVSLSTQPVGFGYVENRIIILPHKGHDRNFE